MDTTIRNLDERAYRAIRARAVIEGRPVGELITQAIKSYIARTAVRRPGVSLRDLKPEPFPDGNKNLSAEIDAVVYGSRR